MRRRLSLAILIAFISSLSMFLITNVTTAQNQDPVPTAGSLGARDASGKPAGECPLKHTTVKAEVSGFLSRVTVTQDFENPFTDKIEAVYTFPLPQSAAVDDLTMIIADRTVKGTIMRREEAETAYAAAKQLGKVAALLDQQRPNIFTQQIANIMPGQQIRIVISYVETLKYEDGSYEWSFPMTIGQRYNPSTTHHTPSVNPAYTDRPGHDISLELDLDAGVPIESINSQTHETEVERPDARRALVRLKDRNTIPNKDFVLKYQVAGPAITDAVLAHRSDRGGFFTLILQPPQRVSAEDVTPKELVFVLDTSGSMEGFPLEKAKETLDLALNTLYPHDTFNVITFSGDTNILFPEPRPATRENLRKAKEFFLEREGSGGTEMMKAIIAALKPSDDQQHVRIACFMTDGQVGDDMAIIGEVKKYKNARVFAMGFGDAPNRFLLDNMAQHGRGEVDYVTGPGDTSAVARRFNERVRNPLLIDISIEWSPSLPVTEIYPKRIPDLFSARPVILSGRYLHGGKGTIVLKGKLTGADFVREIPVELPHTEPGNDVLATLWARRKIDYLMMQDLQAAQSGEVKPEVREEITQLGLKFKLMTQFTSFLAVDEVIFTGPEEAVRTEVPLNGPMNGLMMLNTVSVISPSVSVVTTSGKGMINASATTVSRTVTTNSIANLPLQGRSFQDLIRFAPGAVNAQPDQFANYSPAGVAVIGQRPAANMFMIDGVSANYGIAPGGQSPGPSAAGSLPATTASGGANGVTALDTIDELTIRTSYEEPEFGRVPGAQVDVVTRAGTNKFHATLFHFFGNDSFDASGWFANSRGLQKPPRRLNNYGGTIGGPVQRDEIFFFGSYEGLRLRKPMTGITDVPALSFRAAAAPEVQPFLNAFPLPTASARPDGFAEFAATFANSAQHDVGSLRIDLPGSWSSFWGKYSFADSRADERGAGGFSLNTRSRIRSQAQTFTGGFTRTLSAVQIFELRANYSRLRVSGSQALDEFGGGAVNLIPLPDGAFNFDLNGRNAALSTRGEVANVQRQFNAVGSMSIFSGAHDLKFGTDYRRLSPTIRMHTSETSVLFDGPTQALAAIPARVGLFNREASQSPDFNNLSLYAQDEWRKSSRLTLTYGVRWELNPPPSNDGTPPIAVDQVNDPGQLTADAPGASLWQTTFLNFAPRFGFAYTLQAKKDAHLVLRGGFAVLYDLGNERAGDVFADSNPFVSGTPGVPAVVFDPQLKLPYTLNWNVSIERALGSYQTISASYVGTAGRRLLHTQTFLNQNAEFPFLRLTTNAGQSDYRALQLQFRRRMFKGLAANVSYALARSADNVSEDSARNVLMTSPNAAVDRGPSDFDVRNQLTGFVNYDVPLLFSARVGNRILRNWTVDAIFNVRSAKPINVLYMFPTPYGLAYFRPDVVAGEPLQISDPAAPGGRRINPGAFIAPFDLQQGNLGRNSLRGFRLSQIDMALRRRFNFSERLALQFQADAFSVFNHPNFEDPSGRERVFGSMFTSGAFTPNATFGRSSSLLGQSVAGSSGNFGSFYNTGGPRVLRFSLKLIF